MALRFRRSIKIAPGVKMNVGKRGINSFSVGRFTFGRRGLYFNFGIPGTGLSYRTKLFGGKKKTAAATSKPLSATEFGLALHEDGTLIGLDPAGKPLSKPALQTVKRENKADILAWLAEQQSDYNAEIEALLTLHLTTPPPTNNPLHLEYENAVQKWEAINPNLDETHHHEILTAILSGVISEIDWPRETVASFDLVGDTVWLDVDLPEIEDLPTQEAQVNKTKLTLTLKDLSQREQRRNYLQHIHTIGFRLIGDIFAHLPPAAAVVFSGYSQRLNKKTAHTETDYLYSVCVTRTEWEQINFDNLDQLDIVACFEQFKLRRKTTKTGIITPITPFE